MSIRSIKSYSLEFNQTRHAQNHFWGLPCPATYQFDKDNTTTIAKAHTTHTAPCCILRRPFNWTAAVAPMQLNICDIFWCIKFARHSSRYPPPVCISMHPNGHFSIDHCSVLIFDRTTDIGIEYRKCLNVLIAVRLFGATAVAHPHVHSGARLLHPCTA